MGLTPAYSVIAGADDITSTVRRHLASLQLSSSLDGTADILEIVLDNADGRLAVPEPGRGLQVSIGYKGTALTDMGTYVHVESRLDLAPARLTVRATAADLTRGSEWKTLRTRAWHDLTLGDVVERLASDHGLDATVARSLATEAVAHIDQTAESDLHLLRRLAEHYDAAVQIRADRLTFLPAGPAETAGTGRAIEVMTIGREAIVSASLVQEDRSLYKSVRAIYYDVGESAAFGVTAGEGTPVYELRETYPDHARATAAAQAALDRLTRRSATLEATLDGDPNVVAGTRIRIPSWPQAADRTWSVTSAKHRITAAGAFTTAVESEAVSSSADTTRS